MRPKQNLRLRLCVGGAAVCMFLPAVAPAQMSPRVTAKEVTPGEQALLPDWCIDSQDGPFGSPEGSDGLNRSPRARQWVSLMGADFWHMHHYCRGLRDLVRLKGSVLTPTERTYLLGRAINEFDYVLKICQPTMPLLPEVLLRRGESQTQMGDLVGAIDSFHGALKLKPDYWPASDRLLGVLIGLKQYDRARALADEALAASPGEPSLLARRQAIGAAVSQPHKPAPRQAAKGGSAPR